MRLGSSLQARSLVSLLDGYFRLTTDAHHYLCHEVAPPRMVLSETNDLHGPILYVTRISTCSHVVSHHFINVFTPFLAPRGGFVLEKLKKEAEEGAFIVRWSVLDYHRIILASLSRPTVML